MDAALRALVIAKAARITVEGSSRRLLLTSLQVYTIVIFSQTELRIRMRATLDGTVLQDLGKPLSVLIAGCLTNNFLVQHAVSYNTLHQQEFLLLIYSGGFPVAFS